MEQRVHAFARGDEIRHHPKAALAEIRRFVGSDRQQRTSHLEDKGYVTFHSLSSALSINSENYTLVTDLNTLASDIAANPAGAFALATYIYANGDGTHSSAPITRQFSGSLDGFGNGIYELKISDPTDAAVVGLFATVESSEA